MIERAWGAAVLRPYMGSAVIVSVGLRSKPRDLGNDRGYSAGSDRWVIHWFT
jgi:hypothetical protein